MAPQSKRRLAQHFLEPAWVNRLIDVVRPDGADIFLEVGAGRGALTFALARSGARVIAVEIDGDLVTWLRERVPPNVTVIHGDFLKVDFKSLTRPPKVPIRVVGNLPYSVGSPILRRLLHLSGDGDHLRDAVVMLQFEVANRVAAEPGTRDWGPLAVAVELHAEATRALTLPPGAFRPMPRVRSAVVTLRFRPSPISVRDRHLFDRLVRSIFTQRRKTAVNALRSLVSQVSLLSAEEVFERAGVDPRRRPGELELSELAELAEVLASTAG